MYMLAAYKQFGIVTPACRLASYNAQAAIMLTYTSLLHGDGA